MDNDPSGTDGDGNTGGTDSTGGTGGPTQAPPCPAGTTRVATVPATNTWTQVKGKLSAVDKKAGTMTIGTNVLFVAPTATVSCSTTADATGTIKPYAFADSDPMTIDLTDSALNELAPIENQLSVTVTAGTSEYTPDSHGACMKRTATAMRVSMVPVQHDEVILNSITSSSITYTPAGGTATTVNFNTDPRFGLRILNPVDERLMTTDLTSQVGALMDVEGYTDKTGKFVVVNIDAEVLIPEKAGIDALISDWSFEVGQGLLVEGEISKTSAGTYATKVSIYEGTESTTGDCMGTLLGTATVVPPVAGQGILASFEYQDLMRTAPPAAICVKSEKGGVVLAEED